MNLMKFFPVSPMASCLAFVALIAAGQTATAQEAAPVPDACRPWMDSVQTTMTVADLGAWADKSPVKVSCDDGMVYTLHRFDISVFTRNPLQTKGYGTGEEGGIPILARRAIDKCSTGDAFIMKNAVYLDANGAEQRLPVISIQVE